MTQILDLQEKEKLQEASYRITSLKFPFPNDVAGNFADQHTPIHPFGPLWGRGIISEVDGELIAHVGAYGVNHALLKKIAGPRSRVIKSFYFGYDKQEKTLYMENASIGNNVNYSNDMFIEIASAITNSPPLRGCVFELKK